MTTLGFMGPRAGSARYAYEWTALRPGSLHPIRDMVPSASSATTSRLALYLARQARSHGGVSASGVAVPLDYADATGASGLCATIELMLRSQTKGIDEQMRA